jgi:hypothetical protein
MTRRIGVVVRKSCEKNARKPLGAGAGRCTGATTDKAAQKRFVETMFSMIRRAEG